MKRIRKRLSVQFTDEELIELATSYRQGVDDDPHCRHLNDIGFLSMNFMVVAPLAGQLSFMGLDAHHVDGRVALPDGTEAYHGWIRLPDNKVLDPCADAFNDQEGFPELPQIYLGPPSKIHADVT
jgi:hypothetical protein